MIINNNKKTELFNRIIRFSKRRRRHTLPQIAVPSALKGLTSLFGMVRGETFRFNHLKSLVNSEKLIVNSSSQHLYF